jgi:hypothetical protein
MKMMFLFRSAALLSAAATPAAAVPADSTAWTRSTGGGGVVTDHAGASYVLQPATGTPPANGMLIKYSVTGREVWRRDLVADGVGDGPLLMDATQALVVAGATTGRYSLRGELLNRIPLPGNSGVQDGASMPGGGVALVQHDKLTVLSPQWTVRWSMDLAPALSYTHSVAITRDGQVWVAQLQNRWVEEQGGGSSHNIAVISLHDGVTGALRTEWQSTRQLLVGDIAATPDGGVVAVGDGFFHEGDPYQTGAQIIKVGATGDEFWRVSGRDLHQDIEFSSYAAESRVLVDKTGTVFAGYVSGNSGYDAADGEPNGVAFARISSRGRVQWYHRFQEPAVMMRTPAMALDFTGSLVVSAGGSINHQTPEGNWSRVFRIQPNGVRSNETAALPQYHGSALALASGFLPVVTGHTGRHWYEPEAPATVRLLVLSQVPSGPLVAGAPRLSGDRKALTVPAIARRGPLRWQWLMDDAPVPGAVSATFTIPPDDSTYLDHRAFSVIVSDSTGTVETPILVVADELTD